MTGLVDGLYKNSPVWLQQIMVAGYGVYWYRRRFNSFFHEYVREYQQRERWSREQFTSYQELCLQKLFAVSQGSPYYRQVFRKIGNHSGLNVFETLKILPLLSKETLRHSAKLLLTKSPLPRGVMIQRSSGTTGTPTDIYYTRQFHALELAVAEARSLNWAGVNFQSRRVMFGVRKVANFSQSHPPFWRFSPVEDLAYASIYHLSPQFLPDYLEFLRCFKPELIMGYPSALNTIATFALEKNNLPPPARAVITTSETLTLAARQAIESVWQCKVFDRYGAVESCMFASQCEYGRYHVSPEIGIIEILDADGKPCTPGELGEVVCTGLQNILQPLIRYRVGDMARWAVDQSCQCGRKMRIIEGVEGRFEDICVTPDGRQLLRFDTVFKGVKNIKEAQIIQEELDRFTILVVPTDGFNEIEISKLKGNMQFHVGRVNTDIQLVREIVRSPSGKFRAVISKVSKEQKHA